MVILNRIYHARIYMHAKHKKALIYLLLAILAAVWWLPLFWSAIVSLKPAGTTQLANPANWFSGTFTLDNYRFVFTNSQSDIPVWLKNSVITAAVSTALIVILSSLAGYAFAKFNFVGKKLCFWVIMAGMMIPFQSLLIPTYIMFNQLSLLNTYWALILPYLGSSFGVILMKQFIENLPDTLFEAARLDGCSSVGIYRYVVLPLIKPAIGSLCIFTFLQQWNDFIWPYISITKQAMMTIPTGIVLFKSQSGMDKGLALAANIVAIMPVLIAFLFFQKNIVKGVTLTGIKE